MSQIGRLRVRADGNTVSVPIFDTGDSGSSVFEMIKIQTGTNTGFIPVVEDSGDAAYPYLKVQTQNHGIVHVHDVASLGLTEIQNYLENDWDDNSLTSRSNTDDDVFAHPDANVAGDVLIGRYRPEWRTNSGSPSTSSSALALSDGSSTQQAVVVNSQFTTGSWQIDIEYQSSSSSGAAGYSFLGQTTDITVERLQKCYWHRVQNSGSTGLFYQDSGGSSTLISGSSVTAGNVNTLKTERDSYGNFEFFVNGTSGGTTTDTQWTTALYEQAGNEADAAVHMDNLVVK